MHLLLVLMMFFHINSVHHSQPLPTSLIIKNTNGHRELWMVATVPGVFHCEGGGNMVGCTECGPKIITLDTAETGRDIAIALRHEAMHAVVNCSNENPSPAWVAAPLPEIHKAIYTFSEKMQDFEHDNPDYIRYVTQY